MPADLYYNEAADTALTSPEADPGQAKVVARVNDALALLEADPGDRRARRRQYRAEIFGVALWGIPVSGGDENWLILWAEHPDEPGVLVVHYIGPDI